MSDPKKPEEEEEKPEEEEEKPVDMPTDEDYLAALGPCGK